MIYPIEKGMTFRKYKANLKDVHAIGFLCILVIEQITWILSLLRNNKFIGQLSW